MALPGVDVVVEAWTADVWNVDGSTGRSKVTIKALAIGVPSAAKVLLSVSPARPTGPIVPPRIRGPAEICGGHADVQELLAVVAAIQVARPRGVDVAVEDGQALAVAEGEGRPVVARGGVAAGLVVGDRPEVDAPAGGLVVGDQRGVGEGLGAERAAAVDARGDRGRHPGAGRVVAGVVEGDDHGARRLVDGDRRLELAARPATPLDDAEKPSVCARCRC